MYEWQPSQSNPVGSFQESVFWLEEAEDRKYVPDSCLKFIEVVRVVVGLVSTALHPIGLDLNSGHRGVGQLIPVCRVEGRSRWSRGCSSAGRAPDLHSGGRRFDPDQLHQFEPLRPEVIGRGGFTEGL